MDTWSLKSTPDSPIPPPSPSANLHSSALRFEPLIFHDRKMTLPSWDFFVKCEEKTLHHCTIFAFPHIFNLCHDKTEGTWDEYGHGFWGD